MKTSNSVDRRAPLLLFILSLLPAYANAQTNGFKSQTITLPDGRPVQFPIDAFSKYCLLNGVDQLGFLQGLDGQIAEYEGENAARVNTVG